METKEDEIFVIEKGFTDKEFEEMWRRSKEREAREEAVWNELPEEEKDRLCELYSDGFYERISDDPTGGHDDEY